MENVPPISITAHTDKGLEDGVYVSEYHLSTGETHIIKTDSQLVESSFTPALTRYYCETKTLEGLGVAKEEVDRFADAKQRGLHETGND